MLKRAPMCLRSLTKLGISQMQVREAFVHSAAACWVSFCLPCSTLYLLSAWMVLRKLQVQVVTQFFQ